MIKIKFKKLKTKIKFKKLKTKIKKCFGSSKYPDKTDQKPKDQSKTPS